MACTWLVSRYFGFWREESAGASTAQEWQGLDDVDKDGTHSGLAGSEIWQLQGKDPGEHFRALESNLAAPGTAVWTPPAARESYPANLSPEMVKSHYISWRPHYR